MLQEENQRSLASSSNVSSDAIAMAVRNVGTRFQAGKNVKKTSQENKENLVCEFCHMTGHTKDKCYCIHGFPSWHKLFGKPKPNPRHTLSNTGDVKHMSAAQVTSGIDMNADSSTSVVGSMQHSTSTSNAGTESMSLSKSQCKQIIQLLQQSLSTNSSNSSASADVQPNSWYTQFAGTSLHLANNVYPAQTYTADTWIVDTGATDHITPFGHLLHNVTVFQSTLHLPNGATAAVTHVGSVTLSSDIVLHNVLCVPTFTYHLLSVSKLLSDNKCVATFTPKTCTIQAPTWGTAIEIGKEQNGLYLLRPSHLIEHSASSVTKQGANAAVSKTQLWHYRLGHVPVAVLKLLPIDGLANDVQSCDNCQ